LLVCIRLLNSNFVWIQIDLFELEIEIGNRVRIRKEKKKKRKQPNPSQPNKAAQLAQPTSTRAQLSPSSPRGPDAPFSFPSHRPSSLFLGPPFSLTARPALTTRSARETQRARPPRQRLCAPSSRDSGPTYQTQLAQRTAPSLADMLGPLVSFLLPPRAPAVQQRPAAISAVTPPEHAYPRSLACPLLAPPDPCVLILAPQRRNKP
jgi:hypothetical protein